MDIDMIAARIWCDSDEVPMDIWGQVKKYRPVTAKHFYVKADQIIAILQAEKEELFRDGDKTCPHMGEVNGIPVLRQHDCYVCWDALKQKHGVKWT